MKRSTKYSTLEQVTAKLTLYEVRGALIAFAVRNGGEDQKFMGATSTRVSVEFDYGDDDEVSGATIYFTVETPKEGGK